MTTDAATETRIDREIKELAQHICWCVDEFEYCNPSCLGCLDRAKAIVLGYGRPYDEDGNPMDVEDTDDDRI